MIKLIRGLIVLSSLPWRPYFSSQTLKDQAHEELAWNFSSSLVFTFNEAIALGLGGEIHLWNTATGVDVRIPCANESLAIPGFALSVTGFRGQHDPISHTPFWAPLLARYSCFWPFDIPAVAEAS